MAGDNRPEKMWTFAKLLGIGFANLTLWMVIVVGAFLALGRVLERLAIRI
jgi:hypothetical protein